MADLIPKAEDDVKKILHPTDFSPLSQTAFVQAESLARTLGAKLIILHVAEPPVEFRGAENYAGEPNPNDPVILDKLRSIIPVDPTIPYEHCVRAGDAANEIIRVAAEEQVEMIVMTTHERRRLRRLLHGSVAEYVVRHATRPVLVVKQSAIVAD